MVELPKIDQKVRKQKGHFFAVGTHPRSFGLCAFFWKPKKNHRADTRVWGVGAFFHIHFFTSLTTIPFFFFQKTRPWLSTAESSAVWASEFPNCLTRLSRKGQSFVKSSWASEFQNQASDFQGCLTWLFNKHHFLPKSRKAAWKHRSLVLKARSPTRLFEFSFESSGFDVSKPGSCERTLSSNVLCWASQLQNPASQLHFWGGRASRFQD